MTAAMRNFLCCLIAVFAALEGCSPPPGTTCRRLPIDPRGNLAGSFAGGSGGGTGLAGTVSPLGIVNTTLTLTVFAPVSGCQGEQPVVNATLVDARNQLGPTPTSSVPFVGVGVGAISSTVSVLPTAPGRYTLRVAFEPSLGARELIIDVAEQGLDHPVTRVPIPNGSGCSLNRVWPLADDTVACEAGAVVTVTSADGGRTSFPGATLVVVDNVLWSVNATERLERREWADGGLLLTHSFPDFPPAPTPGMHDLDVALRYRTNGRLSRVRVWPDGGADFLQYALSQAPSPLVYFVEEDGGVPWRWSRSSCSAGACFEMKNLVALEAGHVWHNAPRENVFGLGPLRALARPLSEPPANPRFGLEYEPEALVSPEAPFEQLPLWLEPGPGAQKVLVSITDADLVLTAWPRAEVLRVGRHHVVLADRDPLTVRVSKR